MITRTANNILFDIAAVGQIPIVTDMLEIICKTTGMGFAAIARVTDQKWVACAVHDQINFGLKPGGELILETTICNEIRQSGELVVIDDVSTDEIYACHHTPTQYGFKSYISVPIYLKDKSFFGTLCAIDPNPAHVNSREIIGMFKFYADLLSFHLDASKRLEISESELIEEKQTAELRDQFIAILGHDLRNPVGAVNNVAQLMLRMPLDDRMKRLANIIKDASFRMNELIENVLDFARGRLGEGINLERSTENALQDKLSQVIAELELVWPENTIEADFDISHPVYCDSKRIAQLFSNLLGNALTHGKKDEPVKVKAVTNSDGFELKVVNYGQKIPGNVLKKLFQPFSRGEIKPGQQGLGLGLYISSEIAKAHGGRIAVKTTETETSFKLLIPA
ncbi:GAF domain-containing sensor histidine kinase [Mucilaginibacter segetis]|uniref:histidine kinase n=1 Tax=Mucilaginibacter segetis TaxID=2793071 RepID=A0A934PR92_9SPHI|nr:GAF domain-containing sensor histidine kinase [Mucilaginibacter segetis]MBK0378151.1 GAF domain-containing sensor histidine kinase [Mucilaginibacter segetis]